jgi:hypothetical protein
MTMVDPDTMRRLALIRILLMRAENDSRLSIPFSFDSVNRLHDVAEMFLALAAQHYHVQIPREFNEYWSCLETPLGRPLTYRAQMQKFNKIRVNLKHYGVEPSQTEIDSARQTVHGLLYDECPNIFGLALEDVSLSNFVTSTKARGFLNSASSRWPADPTEAFADLDEAFTETVRDYEMRKVVTPRVSIFDTQEASDLTVPRVGVTSAQAKFYTAVAQSIKALEYEIMIVGLGVDLRRYGKFKSLMPTVFYNVLGGRSAIDRPGIVRRDQDFEFCRDFIISTAIHLAEFDYDFDLYELYRDAVRADRERKAREARAQVESSGKLVERFDLPFPGKNGDGRLGHRDGAGDVSDLRG